MSYKDIPELMEHLNANGIHISGEHQKRQLMNTGYFHGYKGYRFFQKSNNRIPFSNYDEVYRTIQYDSYLKSLFYPQIMFIETSVKNIALNCIMDAANSENIQEMCNQVICSYSNCPQGANALKIQENKLKLENKIHSALFEAYKNKNPKITHFYNNMSYMGAPLWALFEILTLGDFAFLLSCLTYNTRDAISKELGLNVISTDTNRELIYKYIYTLKDLRNAIAHNDVIFDTRFRKIDPSPAMKACLCQEFTLPYVNFKTLGDYLFLVCYYLKILGIPSKEILSFLYNFENITNEYTRSVSRQVSSIVIHPDLPSRTTLVKKEFEQH